MFRNRGKLPNINNGGNNGNNGGYNAPHYSHYWNGRFIVIRYDKTFIAIELIATFLILLVIFAVYLFAYPVTFEDQIAELKQTFSPHPPISKRRNSVSRPATIWDRRRYHQKHLFHVRKHMNMSTQSV